MKLTEQDKRSLVVLAVFMACAVYYLFCFDPMLQRRGRLLREVGKAQRHLADTTRKANELKSWQQEQAQAAAKVADIRAGLNPGLTGPQAADVLRGVVQAAQSAGLALNSLQPQTLEPPAKGKAPGLALTVTGAGSMAAIDTFLGNLGGMEIKALSIGSPTDARTPGLLGLTARLERLEATTLQQFKLPASAATPPAATAASDPFAKRAPPAPVPPPAATPKSGGDAGQAAPAAPEAALPPPAPALSLTGFSLIGMARVDERSLAAIVHGSPAICDYIWQGDAIGDYTLSAIDSSGVELQDAAGTKARLELPPDKGPPAAAPADKPATPATPPPAGKPGKLGLQLEALTAESAKNRGLDAAQGLLVTKAREGDATVQVGDVLLAINGDRVPTLHRAMQAMTPVHAGDDVALRLLRQGQEKSVVLKATE